MFRDKKILPRTGERKEKLDSVPSNDVIDQEHAQVVLYEKLVDKAITPITFFDMKDGHQGYYISTIMSLPLEIQANDNFNMYRNQELIGALTNSDLRYFGNKNSKIHSENVYGALVEAVINNFQIFAYNAPTFDIMNVGFDIRNNVYSKFGYAVYNNVQGCMDTLKNYLDYTYKIGIYSINDVDRNSFDINQNRLDRTIGILNVISNQVNEMIAFIICDFISYYLHRYIVDLSDADVQKVINNIQSKFSINENLKLTNRIAIKSFLGESLRQDIKTILTNNIIPVVNHICDNAGITTFFIYDDIADERTNKV